MSVQFTSCFQGLVFALLLYENSSQFITCAFNQIQKLELLLRRCCLTKLVWRFSQNLHWKTYRSFFESIRLRSTTSREFYELFHNSYSIEQLLQVMTKNCHYIENTQIICRANKLTSFYMITLLAINGLMQQVFSCFFFIPQQLTLTLSIKANLLLRVNINEKRLLT